MKPNEENAIEFHPWMVERLFKKGITPEYNLLHAILGLAGESGEIADVVKKHIFNGHVLNRSKLLDELGDVEFYLEAVRQHLGLSRETVLAFNIEKLRTRYPSWSYSDKASIERKDVKA